MPIESPLPKSFIRSTPPKLIQISADSYIRRASENHWSGQPQKRCIHFHFRNNPFSFRTSLPAAVSPELLPNRWRHWVFLQLQEILTYGFAQNEVLDATGNPMTILRGTAKTMVGGQRNIPFTYGTIAVLANRRYLRLGLNLRPLILKSRITLLDRTR